MNCPTTPSRLLESLRTDHATSPRLIWYGPGGERVELSGRVLDNWAAKTANLLVDELDAGPGTRVRLDLPSHWKSLVWSLGAWTAGCTVIPVRGGTADDADIFVTDQPDAESPRGAVVVAVALGALEMAWSGELPPGTLDYAAEVRSHGDVYLGAAEAAPADSAVEVDGESIAYADLVVPMEGATGTVLIPGSLPLVRVLRESAGVWAAGGAVMLVHEDVEVTDRLLQSERVTSRL